MWVQARVNTPSALIQTQAFFTLPARSHLNPSVLKTKETQTRLNKPRICARNENRNTKSLFVLVVDRLREKGGRITFQTLFLSLETRCRNSRRSLQQEKQENVGIWFVWEIRDRETNVGKGYFAVRLRLMVDDVVLDAWCSDWLGGWWWDMFCLERCVGKCSDCF